MGDLDKNIISAVLAKELKRMGFDEPCEYAYYRNKCAAEKLRKRGGFKYKAPTVLQVCSWLKERYEIDTNWEYCNILGRTTIFESEKHGIIFRLAFNSYVGDRELRHLVQLIMTRFDYGKQVISSIPLRPIRKIAEE